MLNLILTLLAVPFVPVFMYGNFVSGADIPPSKNISTQNFREEVLGENDEKNNLPDSGNKEDNFQRYNLFPLDMTESEYMPVRKKDYVDTKIFSSSSVAIDVDSGTILHYDNGRKRTQVASLTKMMTAIIIIESIKDLDEEVEITSEALAVPGTVVGCPTSVFCNSNRMYRGEKIKAIDLLKVMLLNSANDAATALGIHVAGSVDRFSEMMNEKAKNLGLKDTHFCTPSGLETDDQEDQCYSTAYDIARIAAYSLKYDMIWDIMKIPEGQFYSTDGKYMHEMKNTDLLLGEIPNCIGGKTGFTPLAGKSLMMGSVDATKKHKVIAVLLDDENRWEDMKKLVNWVFNNYEWK